MKTKETLLLETALDEAGRKNREYGCEEVTIGFKSKGHGDEIVDYMTMDSQNTFKCYEIKVSLSDLKTENKKSFYGDYNYLVVSKALYAKDPVWSNYIPPYCGILVGEELVVKRQAKKKEITDETRNMLKDSLLRSVFWKYENYKDAKDLSRYREMEKQLHEKEAELEQIQRENERMIWTYRDYEFWYRKNHQDPSFSIEKQAKLERKQAMEREKKEVAWIRRENRFVCPHCAFESDQKTPFCPCCGYDLRN